MNHYIIPLGLGPAILKNYHIHRTHCNVTRTVLEVSGTSILHYSKSKMKL